MCTVVYRRQMCGALAKRTDGLWGAPKINKGKTAEMKQFIPRYRLLCIMYASSAAARVWLKRKNGVCLKRKKSNPFGTTATL